MIITLPDALIPATIDRGRITPTFLSATDLPWLSVLLDEFRRFQDRPERELKERLQLPLPCSAPPFKLRAAVAYMERRWSTATSSVVKPNVARETLFLASAAAGRAGDRKAVAIEVAERIGISVSELEQALIADLPGERGRWTWSGQRWVRRPRAS
jgi:predicted nuclease of restriction endonuclease-like RecB superfamily